MCSALNETADLLYEALNKQETLKGRVMRVYSKTIERKMKDRNIPFLENSLTKRLADFDSNYFNKEKEHLHDLRAELKRLENSLFIDNPIIVTTCGAASD